VWLIMSKVQFDFAGENFIVTGASSGMGRQVATELVEAGAKVLGIALQEKELQDLHEQYPNIIPASLDVCDSVAMEKAVHTFAAEYGKIKGAVHAAGIAGLTPLRAYDENQAKKIMEISFFAGAKFMQIVTSRKVCQDGASAVWFASESAHKTDAGLFAYSGTKAAVVVAAKAFAKELAKRRIRVNTISPGWVKTNMTKDLGDTHNMDVISAFSLFGYGEPEDVSGMVLYLLSDRAKWITGADMQVSGGFGI